MSGFKTPTTRVKLGSPSTRSTAHAIAVLVSLAVVAFLLATVVSIDLSQPQAAGTKAFSTILLGGISAAMLWLAWICGRGICFPGAYIEIDGQGIEIRDGSTLDEPIRAAWAELMLIAVDEPELLPARHRLPVFRRVPWAGAPSGYGEQLVGSLVSPYGAQAVEITSGAPETNCAVLFRTPKRVSAHKRQGLRARRRDIDVVTGVLLLSAKDPDQLKYICARSGVLRRVTTDDLAFATAAAQMAPPAPPVQYAPPAAVNS